MQRHQIVPSCSNAVLPKDPKPDSILCIDQLYTLVLPTLSRAKEAAVEEIYHLPNRPAPVRKGTMLPCHEQRYRGPKTSSPLIISRVRSTMADCNCITFRHYLPFLHISYMSLASLRAVSDCVKPNYCSLSISYHAILLNSSLLCLLFPIQLLLYPKGCILYLCI